MDKLIKNLKRRKEVNEGATNSYKKAAETGWFVSGQLGFSSFNRLIFFMAQSTDIDKVFIDIYSSEIIDLCKMISSDYPRREKMLSECLLAHNSGMYYLSTMGFLSLADGLFHDSFKCSIFQRAPYIKMAKESICQLKKDKDRVSNVFNDYFIIYDMYFNALSVLEDKLCIAYSQEMRDGQLEYLSSINRHVIVHGEDTEYGTRVNSLKSFSFLCFLYDLIDILRRYSTSGDGVDK